MAFRDHNKINNALIVFLLLLTFNFFTGHLKAAEITWEFNGTVNLGSGGGAAGSGGPDGTIEGYFTHDRASNKLSDINVKATVFNDNFIINQAGAVDGTWLRGMVANQIGAVGFYLKAADLKPNGADSTISNVGAGKCSNVVNGHCSNVVPYVVGYNIVVSQKVVTPQIKTAKEAFTEVKGDIGANEVDTTKQIRSFATATTAVVSSARGHIFSSV